MERDQGGNEMLQTAPVSVYSPDIEFEQFSFPFEACLRAMMKIPDEVVGYDRNASELAHAAFGLSGRNSDAFFAA